MCSVANTNLPLPDRLIAGLEALLRRYPDEKTVLLQAVGAKMLGEVRGQLARAGFSDGGTKLAAWQEYHIGTGRGYVAVRPIALSGGANSPGAITTYNEVGHVTRRPSGRDPDYRPQINVLSVQGYHFYARTAPRVADLAAEELSRLAELLARELENAV